MSITTFSQFFQPMVITSDNQNLNFDEGSGELTAVLEIGSYTHSEIPAVIKTAMDAVGVNTYAITLDRASRKYTIAADGTFDLLISTGSTVGTGPFTLLGFTGADVTGLTSYEGDSEAGLMYRPQFLLQDYVGPDESQEKIDSTVNGSADGTIEMVSYGTRKFIEMSLKFITSRTDVADGKVILSNAAGKEDAIAFFENIITKNKFEFMPDRDTPTTFYKVLLESTPSNSKGLGFKLEELVGEGLPNIYEINGIVLRIVD